MRFKRYLLDAGRLKEDPVQQDRLQASLFGSGESWIDIQDAGPEELRMFLALLDLHPTQLKRCLDSVNEPGVVSFGRTLLMEYPAEFDRESMEPAYLTILLQDHVLVTVRHGAMGALDDLASTLTGNEAPLLLHLPQIIYLILDQFTDLNVGAQVALRDQMQVLSNKLDQNPGAVRNSDLSFLRAQVQNLVSLVENEALLHLRPECQR